MFNDCNGVTVQGESNPIFENNTLLGNGLEAFRICDDSQVNIKGNWCTLNCANGKTLYEHSNVKKEQNGDDGNTVKEEVLYLLTNVLEAEKQNTGALKTVSKKNKREHRPNASRSRNIDEEEDLDPSKYLPNNTREILR